jgi:hypothetical protein
MHSSRRDEVSRYLDTLALLYPSIPDERAAQVAIRFYLEERYGAAVREHPVSSDERDDRARIDIHLPGPVGLDDATDDVGIEIKLARSLQTLGERQKLIGQAAIYNVRRYRGRLLVVVVGRHFEFQDKRLDEVERVLEALGIAMLRIELHRSRADAERRRG